MDEDSRVRLDVCRGDILDGKYRVDRVLGSGGMGVVIAAHHMGLDKEVAIKLLLPEALEDPEAAARFEREARAAAKIKSEHIARVMDVSAMEDGSPYMVMEYLEGEDLRARLKREGPLPIREAVDLVLQTCEVLAEAHALGIIHRDLKPANLFCISGADGAISIKVLDFGISKITGTTTSHTTLTKTSALMGSPSYMSPEQIQSPRGVDARTDIWAIGVVLYELLTGMAPFDGESVPEICLRVTKRTPPPLRHFRPETPPPLEVVIARCLQKGRTKRYANVAELSLALAPFGTERVKLSVGRIAQLGRSARGASMFPPSDPNGAPPQSVPISWWKTAKWVVVRRRLTWTKGTIAAAALIFTGIVMIGADLLSRRSGAPASAEPLASAPATPSASGSVASATLAPSAAADASNVTAPPADCLVDLNSVPSSIVSIDGRKIGATPKLNVAASPGQHVVVFQHGARDRVTTSIDCKSGEAKTVSVQVGHSTSPPRAKSGAAPPSN